MQLGDPERFDLSLTLGGAEVRLLDLTAAYGAFAAGGVFHPPLAITRAEDVDGRALSVADQEPTTGRTVLSPETTWLIDDVLGDDAARGPGFGRDGVLHVPRRSVAVKTGTTSDFRDNWTIGFTPDVVVGVWVGNADNHPMREVSGVTGAAPLWRDVLDGVLGDDRAPRAFQRPADLVQVILCADSAELAGPACPSHRLEWLMPTAIDAPQIKTGSPAMQLRIAYPDPGMVIVLDATLPSSAQQVPIQIDADRSVDYFQILIDGVPIGGRSSSGLIGWPPRPGRHVLRAIGAGVESASVEIEVVPS
jgi:membrane carboxypeptidase/penicillin-binding protein PbpC